MVDKSFSYPVKVFIGFDQRQPVAYTVAAQSLMANSTHPVSITPLLINQLPMNKRGLTEFTFTRYLVPWLCDFQGEALFMDADVLVTGDVSELFTLPWEDNEAVKVVQNTLRFEWPSVMLFKNSRCTILTPDFVEQSAPHTLEWAPGIGKLPHEWNYLVGYEEECGRPENPKLWHFTEGIPLDDFGYEILDDTGRAEWDKYLKYACRTPPWEQIMGNSVHKKHLEQKKIRRMQRDKLAEGPVE